MTAAAFLARIAASRRHSSGRRVAAVVAHPDDETLGCGALLRRLPGATLVHVTDGAPRDLEDARKLGFSSGADYAAARRAELDAALALGGIDAERVRLDLPDKGAARALAPLARRLASLFESRDIRLVLTHAYEGGHPDHDACAFAVHHAARRAGRIDVVEMPFYRLGSTGPVNQDFEPDRARPAVELRLTAAERARKAAMLACFASQRSVISTFATDIERFRPAPAPTFDRPPNGGRVLYEGWGWGLTAKDWCAQARNAARALAARPASNEARPCP